MASTRRGGANDPRRLRRSDLPRRTCQLTNVDRRDLLAHCGVLLSAGVLAGCAGRVPTQSSDPPARATATATATATRASPDVAPETLATLVDGNTAFGLALHRTLVDAEPDSNAFLSPYSLSLVLAMARAGAAGETRSAMADALRLRLDGDRLHPAFNRLDRTLEAQTEAAREAAEEDDDYRLTAVNAAWTQEGSPFRDAFLDTLARHYGAGMNLVDFRSAPDAARTRVTDWVADGRIDDLLPEGVVTELTRFVPTNAVHFEATWTETFDGDDSRPGELTALDGTTREVPMMAQTARFPYATVDRPFLLLVRDRETGTVRFLGRVVDAAAAQGA